MPLTERHIAPSILSADFADLSAQVREVMDAGARVIHCDVMDGHFVPPITKAGADGITIHAESTPHIDYTLSQIRELGCRAGLVVCPGTAPDWFAEVDVDLALIMTVNPGWGGQPFLRNQLDKVRRVREMLGDTAIQVDGGVNAKTVVDCAQAGATWFVAGSAIFNSDDPAAMFREIAAAAGCALPTT